MSTQESERRQGPPKEKAAPQTFFAMLRDCYQLARRLYETNSVNFLHHQSEEFGKKISDYWSPRVEMIVKHIQPKAGSPVGLLEQDLHIQKEDETYRIDPDSVLNRERYGSPIQFTRTIDAQRDRVEAVIDEDKKTGKLTFPFFLIYTASGNTIYSIQVDHGRAIFIKGRSEESKRDRRGGKNRVSQSIEREIRFR